MDESRATGNVESRKPVKLLNGPIEGVVECDHLAGRSERNVLAEAFIRGIEAGAEEPWLAGDGDAMYAAFRRWRDTNG